MADLCAIGRIYGNYFQNRMIVDLPITYSRLSARGSLTEPLRLPTNLPNTLPQYWLLNTPERAVTLDWALLQQFRSLKKSLNQLSQVDGSCPSSHIQEQVEQKLKDWLNVCKKMEFYHVAMKPQALYVQSPGLLDLYHLGSLESIYFLSQLQKYQPEFNEAPLACHLKLEERELLFRDISLKLAKRVIYELQKQMYFPSETLPMKILQNYSVNYRPNLSLYENYAVIVAEKQLGDIKESRQATALWFSLKIAHCATDLRRICRYLSYLKNLLLDRTSGVLSGQYETWLLIYEASLKLYCRHETVRKEELISIDQILTGAHSDPEFHSFMVKNIEKSQVNLSCVNFYLKNIRKEERDQLDPLVRKKLSSLFEGEFWKEAEDIWQFVENDTNQHEKRTNMKKIIEKITSVTIQEVPESEIYHAQKAITYLSQAMTPCLKGLDSILSSSNLVSMLNLLKEKKGISSKTILSFTLFNQFLSNVYTEAEYENWRLPDTTLLINTASAFLKVGLFSSKATVKLLYHCISSQLHPDDELQDRLFQLVAELYFAGTYEDNTDLEVIPSVEEHNEILEASIKNIFNKLATIELIEHKEFTKCLQKNEQDQDLKACFFAWRGYKDDQILESTLNISLIFTEVMALQPLQLGLLYCSPFCGLQPWRKDEEQPSLLSILCEQQPIQVLKLVFRELGCDSTINWSIIKTLPPAFWRSYSAVTNRQDYFSILAEVTTEEMVENLQQLRRFEFILNLTNCVFDKLNEQSQKGIKEIKIIYQNGCCRIIEMAKSLSSSFLVAVSEDLTQQTKRLNEEEISLFPLAEPQTESFVMTSLISRNNLLFAANEFNQIGQILESPLKSKCDNTLVPVTGESNFKAKQTKLQKLIELCVVLEVPFLDRIGENGDPKASLRVQLSQQWTKNVINIFTSLRNLMVTENHFTPLQKRIVEHIKIVMGHQMLPETLRQMLKPSCKGSNYEQVSGLMKASLRTLYTVDSQHQEHFIMLLETLEAQMTSSNKNEVIDGSNLLGCLRIFLELVMEGIKIRSYHLYRMAKHYLKLSGEPICHFNSVISTQIKGLFEQFLTGFSQIPQLVRESTQKHNLPAIYHKFTKKEMNLNYIQAACTLSMYINLYCRLNHASLTVGIEHLLQQQTARVTYLEYLDSLTLKMIEKQPELSDRDRQVLKVDVYGNLNCIAKGKFTPSITQKFMELSKKMLKVNVDLKKVNKLPIKILADKMNGGSIELNLQDFEEQCKAVSLGALSLHRQLSSLTKSNVHLCNLFYLTGSKGFEKSIQLNQSLLGRSRSKRNKEVEKVAVGGLESLIIDISQDLTPLLKEKAVKLASYYEKSRTDSDFADKLYGLFKSLTISCLNLPEITPILLGITMEVNSTKMTFSEFIVESLETCLPLFCEFYIAIIKTNSGFLQTQEGFIPHNLKVEFDLKLKLLSLLESQVSKGTQVYPYLPAAVSFIQQYSENSRMGLYRCMRSTHNYTDGIIRQFDKFFNGRIINICQQSINSAVQSQKMSCRDEYVLLETALTKYHTHSSHLDLKKMQTQASIARKYISQMNQEDQENRPQFTRKKISQQSRLEPTLPSTVRQLCNLAATPYTLCKGKLKTNKQIQQSHLQEDIISLGESKAVAEQWKSQKDNLNSRMVDSFMMINEEMQGREFLREASIYPQEMVVSLQVPNEFKEEVSESENDGIIESSSGLEDGIIEESSDSIRSIKEDLKSEQSSRVMISGHIIESGRSIAECSIPLSGGSIVYSDMELSNGDGSMKFFKESEGLIEEEQDEDEVEEVTKNTILDLIEDYTLNPEAIKQIALKVKFITDYQLRTLLATQTGEVADVIEGEIRNRGIVPFEHSPNKYDEVFMDESKVYDRLKYHRKVDFHKELNIPLLNQKFAQSFVKMVLGYVSSGQIQKETRSIASFLKKVLLNQSNISLILAETVSLISLSKETFELQCKDLVFDKKKGVTKYKQALVDHILGVMVDYRVALPILFQGKYDPDTRSISAEKGHSIIDMVIQVLIEGEQESPFLASLTEYFKALRRTNRFQYPYYHFQNKIILSEQLPQMLIEKMHQRKLSFRDRPRETELMHVMTFLSVHNFEGLLRVELSKTSALVKKILGREESIMGFFKRSYGSQNLQVERKADIYWQLRKSRNADEWSGQLSLSRKVLSDIASLCLTRVKEDCLWLDYRDEWLSMREELARLGRKINEAHHYSEKTLLRSEFTEKEKRYLFEKSRLMNILITDQIVPAIEELSQQFQKQISRGVDLLSELHRLFEPIAVNTPIIFKQCGELYELMLALELMKVQEEQQFYSMSSLKTIPTIKSTREMGNSRRRSSVLSSKNLSLLCSGVVTLQMSSLIKKSALMLPFDSLSLSTNDPLFMMHAKYGDAQSRIKFLKSKSKKEEKVIEVSRNRVWADSAPHFNQTMANFDIKIKFSGQIGLDYGGVTQEWATLITKQILNPQLGLFELNANQQAFQPSRHSSFVPNSLDNFKRFGVFVGKAMTEGWQLDLSFTKSFLKHMLGSVLYVQDLEDLEPDTAKGLLWILKNQIDEDLGVTFTYEEETVKGKKVNQLVPGGNEILVNEQNKKEYIKKLALTKMTENIRDQSVAFLEGLEKVIPAQTLRMFTYKQIGRYLAGSSTIDVDQMRKTAKYEGFHEQDPCVQWFWSIMAGKDQEWRSQFLFFLTGAYRVPYSGFKESPVVLNRMGGCVDYLPVAHTCFSIIDLSDYSSEARMRDLLEKAVAEGKGFTVS